MCEDCIRYPFPYMIQFDGEFYANELYHHETGRKVADIESAKATAEEQFPDMGWTIYNGHHSFTQDAKGMQ